MRLYEDMLDQPEKERDTWLQRACADNSPALEAVRAMTSSGAMAYLLPTCPPAPQPISDKPETAPARVGRYRIVRELGRGGMGAVYLGERDDGLFEHGVAIKLIRQAIFSERALAQFSTERRILARLHHPHIAQMHDGGVTEDGASYIIMERVEGLRGCGRKWPGCPAPGVQPDA